MIPFILSFFILFALGLIECLDKNRNSRYISFIITFFMLVSLASFRSVGVGSDDAAYLSIFEKIPSVYECQSFICGYRYTDYNIEFGFYLFLSLLSIFGVSSYLLFGSVATVAVYLNLKAIFKFSPFVAAGALVYFSHFFLAKDMNAIRLGIASSILFYSIFSLVEKRYYAFILLLALASLFHISSVLMVIPIALYYFKPTRLSFIIISVCSLLFYSLIDFKSLISTYFLAGFWGEKIQLYLNAEKYNYSIPITDIVNLKNLSAVIASFFFWEILNKNYRYFYVCFCFFFCAVFFRIVLGDFAIVAGRGYAVFSMFEYIIIPMLAVTVFGRVFGFSLVGFYSLVVLYLNLVSVDGWSGGVNYFMDFL